MVQLVDGDIKTREVLTWKGLHLLHAQSSSCSQKVRIVLGLKGVPWESHLIDLRGNENWQPWFLGINPRGLVPVLVHDGVVHIESNDILVYLDRTFPTPRLIPEGQENAVGALLRHEDELHLDLRTLSFRFLARRAGPYKSEAAMRSYLENGSETVGGIKDDEKALQAAFWERAGREGFPDDMVRASAQRFRAEFDKLDRTLAGQPYLLGGQLSVLDVAWFIYSNRLASCGYPFARLHPHVHAWAERLRAQPGIAREIALPAERQAMNDAVLRENVTAGGSLEAVAGF